ncbi:hypothetical protein HPB50_025895 [Hyalomma asiaticum]|uniref:Uncharacterized protein n=1 Tax=Hyalomma asiaticum TaxID=266040 RepID=A0ACB7TPH1_HYAAI|nr:hypothetical protein HPB50_025895 [Hyalomma asiaticum]
MCGFLKPSLGNARRICRISRSEWWRQVRFFHDCLVVACSTETTYRQQGSLQEWRATTKRVTEFLWNVVRPTLPTKKKKGRPQGDIRTLGDCSVPENVRNVLCLGPKFAFEPKVPPAERVALSRSISRFVPEGEQARLSSHETFDLAKVYFLFEKPAFMQLPVRPAETAVDHTHCPSPGDTSSK